MICVVAVSGEEMRGVETGAKVFGNCFWAVRSVEFGVGLGCEMGWGRTGSSSGMGWAWAARSVEVEVGLACGDVAGGVGAGLYSVMGWSGNGMGKTGISWCSSGGNLAKGKVFSWKRTSHDVEILWLSRS